MQRITFSFGENWRDYVRTVDEHVVRSAGDNIGKWLEPSALKNRRILDIGCGSGVHSLNFHRGGAESVLSFDYDPRSVDATRYLWDRAGRPGNWTVIQGNVLDRGFMRTLGGGGGFDIVYAWGCLHHTGSMWMAMENAAEVVRKGGLFWGALYVKGPNYARDLNLKERYNRASQAGKRLMEAGWIKNVMWSRLRSRRNPFTWNQREERGMDTYHDIVDWLGGLPYEVASRTEILDFAERRGFSVRKLEEQPEGGNNVFLLQK